MPVYIYNDVSIQLARTLEFSWVMERDPTYTDAMYTKYTIRVRGFVSESQGSFPGVGGTTPKTAITLKELKDKLEAPRKSVLYKMGDTVMVQVNPGQIDDKLGPDPLPATVREVSSGTFMVECGCVVYLTECDGTVCERSPVVSLRWTQTETFDQNWYSNLVTDGKLIVRSSLLQVADNFRVDCTPPLLPDYIRKVARYTLSPDGLELAFHFEDQEVDRLPPNPATEARGMYIVQAPYPGTLRIGTVMLELTGQKGTSRRDLFIRAMSIAYAKLQNDAFLKNTPVLWGEFKEDLFEPKIAITLSAKMTNIAAPGSDGALPLGDTRPWAMPSVGWEQFGLTSGRDGIAPPDRKRLLGLLAAAFRDPCACLAAGGEVGLTARAAPPSFERADDMLLTDRVGGITTALASLVIGAVGEVVATPLRSDMAPYDTYHLETHVVYDAGNVQMPGTGVGVGGDVSKVVKSHGGMMTLMTAWVAGRTGKPPVLPTFESTNPNIVPLSGSVVANDVVPSFDGQNLTYMVAGYYRHAIIDPKQHEIAPGVAPFYGSLVQQGAPMAAGFWTNLSTWGVLGQPGSNPFVTGGVTPETPPTNPPGFPSQQLVLNQPNNPGGSLGGNFSGGDGGSVYFPPVNP